MEHQSHIGCGELSSSPDEKLLSSAAEGVALAIQQAADNPMHKYVAAGDADNNNESDASILDLEDILSAGQMDQSPPNVNVGQLNKKSKGI